jgi:hypothetical protein
VALHAYYLPQQPKEVVPEQLTVPALAHEEQPSPSQQASALLVGQVPVFAASFTVHIDKDQSTADRLVCAPQQPAFDQQRHYHDHLLGPMTAPTTLEICLALGRGKAGGCICCGSISGTWMAYCN